MKDLRLGANCNNETLILNGNNNWSVLYLGKSGMGKTTGINGAVLQIASKGESVLIIDLANSFSEEQMPSIMKEYLGNRLKIYDALEWLPVNPFDGINISKEDIPFESQETADIIASTLKMGDSQRDIVYEAYEKCLMNRANREITLNSIYEQIKDFTNDKTKKTTAKKVLSKLNPLLKQIKFEAAADWEDIIYTGGEITVFQLSDLPDSIKSAAAEMLLLDLFRYIQHSTVKNPFTLVLDEIQLIRDRESGAFSEFLTRGRKFGLSLLYSTQFLGYTKNKATANRLLQAKTKIIFQPTESDAKEIAGKYLGEPDKDWMRYTALFKTGICIVHNSETANIKNKSEKIIKMYSVEEVIEKLKKGLI